jgi:multiple sugar transport system substrate-binding protein
MPTRRQGRAAAPVWSAIVALCVVVLAAAPERAGAWTLEEAAAPYKGTTIRTIGEALPPLEALAKLKHKFEEQTGITVEVEMYEHSEAVNKVMLDLNSRRGRYDFIIQPHRELGRFVENGHLVALDTFMDDPNLRNPDFQPESVLYEGLWKEISWYDGKMYGYPFTALNMFMWYRADLVNDPKEQEGFKAKYGYDLAPAKTLEQYRDLAEWFTRPDERFYGTALQGKRHEALWYEWLNFLYAYGADMMEVSSGSECGPIIVNSPEAIAATEYYKGLMAFSPPDTLNYFWDDVMALMQQAKVFELIMWNDATYAVAVDEEASTVVGKMGFAPTPTGPSGERVGQVEGWTYLVPAYSKNQEAAFLFIQWMMDYEQQLEQHLNGGASARPDVYATDEVAALPYSQASMDSNAAAIAKPTIPESPQITDILVRELSSYLSDQKSAQEALDTAAVEMHDLLGECAPLKYPVK